VNPYLRWIARLFLAALILPVAGAKSVACAADISVVDDRGVRVSLASSARRIIALAPSITELVFAAGAGDKLVGVPRFSDYPAAATAIVKIGDASRIDVERVLSLQPDLLIGWQTGNQAADIERLEQLGFPVYVAEPATLAAIPRLLRAFGAMAGTRTVAEQAAASFEAGVAALGERRGVPADVRVFYEIWHQPLMTVNGRHMIDDVIRRCGGVNIFADVSSIAPLVSLESVIARRPDVVLGGSSATTPEEFAGQWKKYADYAGLSGVRAVYIDPDYIQRQTPRILRGAQTVCEQLNKIRQSRRMNGQEPVKE
jgi:iron complex transport system substrate-binding protein